LAIGLPVAKIDRDARIGPVERCHFVRVLSGVAIVAADRFLQDLARGAIFALNEHRFGIAHACRHILRGRAAPRDAGFQLLLQIIDPGRRDDDGALIAGLLAPLRMGCCAAGEERQDQ
jgi:hypothetical protein